MSRQIRNTLRCTAALLTIAALMAPAALATRYVAGPSAAATGTTGATGGFAWADAGLGFAVACGGMLTALGLVRMGRHLHVRPEGRAA
jgi:hypothetical protein